jgi:site-specific recombinase XerD
MRAPHRDLAPGTVTALVRQAAVKAGLEGVSPHMLRHTAATQMLRKGASMDEVALVLRHRHLATTAIYAKVDVDALRSIAQPWPEVLR